MENKITTNHLIDQEEELHQLLRTRLLKLDDIRAKGINPFPYQFDVSHHASTILIDFESLFSSKSSISVAGRLMSIRLMGKAAFAHLQDEDYQIQLYFKRDIIGEDNWELFKLFDIGDILGIKGKLFRTKTEERTIEVNEFQLLSKNLRPLPSVKEKEGEVWNRWSDIEERSRHRPIDLILNLDSREVFLKRSKIISKIREFLDSRDFIEVETPILQPLYGGAAARPFTTHHFSLDRILYMRIADELYLKRLITGGLNRVYEISKDFRNEGIDRMHSPEFTMMEFYAAYEDYHFCVNLMEELIPEIAQSINKSLQFVWDDKSIDLTPPFARFSMNDLILESTGFEIINRNRDDLIKDARNINIDVEPEWGVGKIIDEIFSLKVQPKLIQPTFVMDYPIELSPLAKKHRSNPYLVERFELFIAGMETANAFTELNDPLDQRERFKEQAKLRAKGDEEAAPIDEDYIKTLELGMPPTAGLGMGIDRITMLLTGRSSIRDVILFPILRPKDN